MAKKKSIWFKWSHELTKEEKEKVKDINKIMIAGGILIFVIIVVWAVISGTNFYIKNSELDLKLLYCKDYQEGARVALYNKGEPKQVEVTVKGIGDTMEVKTQRVYLAQGETRNLDFPFTINVNECEASKKIIK